MGPARSPRLRAAASGSVRRSRNRTSGLSRAARTGFGAPHIAPECRRIDESGHEADAAEVPGQAVGVRRKGVRHNRGRVRASARTNRHREGADETNRGCLAGNTSGRHSKIADAVAESAPYRPSQVHLTRIEEIFPGSRPLPIFRSPGIASLRGSAGSPPWICRLTI